MKLTILFMLLIYYSLIGIFFIFASPYIGEGYTNNVEIGVINLENQTYYRIDDIFYEDFNQNYGGTNDWNLNNWSLKIDDAVYCKNDDNDDCIESLADSNGNFTYKFDIDLMDCLEDGIFVSGHIVDKSLGYGDGDLYLLVSNDNGITYNQYLVSQGQRIGSWQINLPNTYLINNLKLGFKTENMGSGNYYLDEIKVNCNVESLVSDEETDNDINIGRFFLFLGFGVGLPEDTPTWFNVIFITWQTIMLMMTFGFLYQAIRGS